jgi:hypothetical protein
MNTLNGSCHCGAIGLELAEPPQEVSECNCSICRRIAGLWHYCAPGDLKVSGQPRGYVQGDRTLTTWHCESCACVTHWTAIDPAYGKLGVNLRMFDPALWQGLPRRQVDGDSY